MKKAWNIVSLLLALSLLVSLSLPVMAKTKIDLETYIETFSPNKSNDITLEVGETHTPTAAIWAKDGSCHSSDEDVVTVSAGGTVTAEGEGTAYVVIISQVGSYETYRYTVEEAQKKGSSQKDKNSADDLWDQLGGMQNGLFDGNMGGIFGIVAVAGIPILLLIAFLFYVVISSLIVTSRLRKLIAELEAHPCEGTAKPLAKALKKINPIQRMLFRVGGENVIEKSTWSHLYNQYVLSTAAISDETRKEIHSSLVKLGVFNLQSGGASGSRFSPEERGELGESNVWHVLNALLQMERCHIFQSVRVGNAAYNKEIDNVIVSQKGIFIIEVKTMLHKPKDEFDTSDTVVYEDLTENPYLQIREHLTVFHRSSPVSIPSTSITFWS